MTTFNEYDVGETITFSIVCQQENALGVLTDADPATLTFKYKVPGGTATTKTYALGQITRDSAGHYWVKVTPSVVGDVLLIQWIAVFGDDTAVEETHIVIKPTQF
jgi:hypothetical protein